MKEALTQGGIDNPGNTSLILLAHTLHRSKSWILSHGEYQPIPQEIAVLHAHLKQLLDGFPLPYILGKWSFFGRSFIVTPDVLIPRPETERLVEKALQHAQGFKSPRIIDVGTGSGIIAISLAAELPAAQVYGVDLSLAALRVAQINAQRLNQPRLAFLQGDLLLPVTGPFDLICANLPYIPRHTLSELAVARWEPRLALDGGETGLDTIRRLLKQAQARLSAHGVILLETDSTLGAETLAAAQTAFPTARHRLIHDLAGHDRMIEICAS